MNNALVYMGLGWTYGKEDGTGRFTKPMYAKNNKNMISMILEVVIIGRKQLSPK